MINSEGFSKRLKQLFEYYDLSASSFADKIDVGRASISHILSGRNKPSLDFVMKVVSTFEEVELYWLLNGKGTFPPSQKEIKEAQSSKTEYDEKSPAKSFQHDNIEVSVNELPEPKKIQKVIIFYTDGSFEAYENYPKI